MNVKSLIIYLFIFLFYSIHSSAQSDRNVISSKFKIQKTTKGKKVVIEADIYYMLDKREILIHYTYPDEYIFMSNELGEAKVYYPKKNEVSLLQNDLFSAETDILYMFFTQNMTEMGLKKLGYNLLESKMDGKFLVTRWSSPSSVNNIAEVELVFDDYLPVYTSYTSTDNKKLNKVYYSNYQDVKGYYVPLRTTEILYLAKGDSIVSRKDYFDIKVGSQVRIDYINYQIPDNAKVIKK